MLIAVGVVSVGLLIVGFGGEGTGPLLLGGTIIGIGVASMHYMGMWAMRMPDTMGYNAGLLAVSVLIAIVAGTAALWAALRLGSLRHTLLASLIMGVAVSGMHYTGMAAMQLRAAPGAGMAAMGSGASAEAFLLPLILGITILTFLVTAIVTLAPTEAEIREDAALMERITRLSEGLERRSS
jgi:NO-binding membrane sensor protein with MHYT domain